MWEEVFLVYWWEGREYGDFDSLPDRFKSLVRRAKRSGSKYLVYASTHIPGEGEVYGYARCMGMDNPVRSYGRNRAIGRLRQKALKHGYTIVEV